MHVIAASEWKFTWRLQWLLTWNTGHFIHFLFPLAGCYHVSLAFCEEDGLNELYKPPKPTLLMLFIMQLLGFIIILLIIAAVASMAVCLVI